MKSRAHVIVAQNHMATTFHFKVASCESDAKRVRRVLHEAQALVGQLEDELTEFRKHSPVYQLNQAELGEKIVFTESGIELLELSERIRRQTGGAFDCTAKSSASPGERIEWDAKTLEVWKTKPGVHLGFGAIGKGYALDRVRLLLEQNNITDFVLNSGGSSIVFSGYSQPGEPWDWGWSWKKDDEGEALGVPFEHEGGEAIALGISGTHEQGLHLIDPSKGAPTDRAKSALVAHTSAAEADALSTALFVSGWDRGHELFNELHTTPGMAMIDGDETPVWNGIFQQLWGQVALWALTITSFFGFFGTKGARAQGVDLSTMGLGDSFTPYDVERNDWWLVLPIVSILIVFLHLKKFKRKRIKPLGGH